MPTIYNFVSPGIKIFEIDRSELPDRANDIGPLVIGRFKSGPPMRPVVINSGDQFFEIFGGLDTGPQGGSQDYWRDSSFASPSYASFAAHHWLKTGTGKPITCVRLLGKKNGNNTSAGKAGWETDNSLGTTQGSAGGAYGLFIFPSGSTTSKQFVEDGSYARVRQLDNAYTGTLAAVFYINEGSVALNGDLRFAVDATTNMTQNTNETDQELAGALIKSRTENGEDHVYTLVFRDGSSNELDTINVSLTSDNFRSSFNTDASKTNTRLWDTSYQKKYWLGESYVDNVKRFLDINNPEFTGSFKTAGASDSPSYIGESFAAIIALNDGTDGREDMRIDYKTAESGWMGDYKQLKLFKGLI